MNKGIKLFICLLFLTTSAFAEEIGKFTAIEGRVDVLRKGQAIALPVVSGDAVLNGDILRAKGLSRAQIKFLDDSDLRLAENTRVEIKEYLLNKDGFRDKAVLNLERGKIRAIISKTKGETNFFIYTPNASGSVKGSDLFVFYQRSATGVLVKEGSLTTANNLFPNQTIEVSGGNTLIVPPDQPPAAPRPYIEPELNRHQTDTTPIVKEEDPTQLKGVITKFSGSVRIKYKDTLLWHNARINEALSVGDEIQTGIDGRVEIRLENENIINLKPNSKIILRSLRRNLKTGEYENLIETSIGKIRATVKELKGASKFEIKTPTAVAAVRGTIMYLNILPNLTRAFFEAGKGSLTNIISGLTKIIEEGQNSSSDNLGNVSDPQDTTDEENLENESGWEPDEEYGYTPPAGDEGIDYGGDLEEGEGIFGAPEGGGEPFVNVPFEPTTGPLGPVFSGLSGALTGNFGYFGSFVIDEDSLVSATLTSAGTFLSTAPDSEILPTATLSGTYANPNERALWFADISGTDTQGGAFLGWMGGTWQSWEGLLAGLYIDSFGKAGIVAGEFSGTNDGDRAGTFTGTGDLFVLPITETEILPASLAADSTVETTLSSGNFEGIFGNAEGKIGDISGAFAREYMKIRDELWGVYKEIYGLNYSNPNGLTDFTGVNLGYENDGLFVSLLAGRDNLTGSLKLDILNTYIDYDKISVYRGRVLGTYMEAVGLGTYTEIPFEDQLSFIGFWGEGGASLYYNNSGNLGWAGRELGFIAGEDSPWLGQADFSALGYFYSWPDVPLLLNTPIYTYNPQEENYTTQDGGAFWGYTAGIWKDGEMDGAIASLYIDPDGNAGILRGDISGNYYPDLSMWMASGTLAAQEKYSGGGLDPRYLYIGEGGYIVKDSIDDNLGLFGSFDGRGKIVGYQYSGYTYDFGEDARWGIFDIKLGNENYYEGKPEGITSWSAVMGGRDEDDNSKGHPSYWLTNVSGTWGNDEIRADVTGKFISDNDLGTIEGDLFGVNNGNDGTWVATVIGSWSEEPLTFSGKWGERETSLYYNDGGELAMAGEDYGLIGSPTLNWWTQESFPFLAMGEYNDDEYSDRYIWNTSIQSYNAPKENYTTLDGAAFWGFTAGIWNEAEMDGALSAMYVSPTDTEGVYNAGVLRGVISGNYYPELGEDGHYDYGMWQATGQLSPKQLATGLEIDPEDFDEDLAGGDILNWDYFSGKGTGSFEGGGGINLLYLEGDTLNIADQKWGIWNAGLAGSYTGPTSPFRLAIGGSSDAGAYLIGTLSGEWDSGFFAGAFKGIFMHPNEEDEGEIGTGQMTGDVVGNYIDVPDGTNTWQAAGVGEWVEVTDLLTPELLGFDIEELANFVSVPITEVYTNLLTGKNDFITSATMDISIYQSDLSYLWAALIYGTYSGGPSNPSSWSLNLNNDSDTVTLDGTQWSDGEWLAKVTGAVGGNNIEGAAGGTYDNGNFQGVGAGTVAKE